MDYVTNYEISFWDTSHNSTGKGSIGYIIVHHSKEEAKSKARCTYTLTTITVVTYLMVIKQVTIIIEVLRTQD